MTTIASHLRSCSYWIVHMGKGTFLDGIEIMHNPVVWAAFHTKYLLYATNCDPCIITTVLTQENMSSVKSWHSVYLFATSDCLDTCMTNWQVFDILVILYTWLVHLTSSRIYTSPSGPKYMYFPCFNYHVSMSTFCDPFHTKVLEMCERVNVLNEMEIVHKYTCSILKLVQTFTW